MKDRYSLLSTDECELVGAWFMEFRNEGVAYRVEYDFHTGGKGFERVIGDDGATPNEFFRFSWSFEENHLRFTYDGLDEASSIELLCRMEGNQCRMEDPGDSSSSMTLVREATSHRDFS